MRIGDCLYNKSFPKLQKLKLTIFTEYQTDHSTENCEKGVFKRMKKYSNKKYFLFIGKFKILRNVKVFLELKIIYS